MDCGERQSCSSNKVQLSKESTCVHERRRRRGEGGGNICIVSLCNLVNLRDTENKCNTKSIIKTKILKEKSPRTTLSGRNNKKQRGISIHPLMISSTVYQVCLFCIFTRVCFILSFSIRLRCVNFASLAAKAAAKAASIRSQLFTYLGVSTFSSSSDNAQYNMERNS